MSKQAQAQKRLEDQKMEQLKELQLEKLRETVRIRAERYALHHEEITEKTNIF